MLFKYTQDNDRNWLKGSVGRQLWIFEWIYRAIIVCVLFLFWKDILWQKSSGHYNFLKDIQCIVCDLLKSSSANNCRFFNGSAEH